VAAQRDYHQVPGVPRDAGAKAIKDAFRRLARRYDRIDMGQHAAMAGSPADWC
jgi:DnaJ-class molecular chaperone